MTRWPFVLAALLIASPVRAADQAYLLYAAGKYDEAMKTGAAEGGEGLAVAARAALADETTRDERCLECLRRAEAFARQAIAADPKNPEGHIYLAVTLGYEARIVGAVMARLHDYPGEAKRNLDTALSIDPKNAWALAALGGWNIEIVRTGGRTLANWLYGAKVETGISDFADAFRVAPDNLAIRYQYALSLAGYDPDTYATDVQEALAEVGRDTPQTAYERVAQKRGAELADLWKKGERDAFNIRVRKYQGYPP